MTNSKSDILDVYYGKELVRMDEDFGGVHCHPYEIGDHCDGCGYCLMAQASYSGHTFKVATKVQRRYRDWFYYPVIIPIRNMLFRIKRKLAREDDFF